VGPAPYFRIAGNSLRAGPGDVEVGYYADGAWHIGGKAFLTATADAPAKVRFEGSGAGTHGPFEWVHLVDGAIRHGVNAAVVLAKFDEDSQQWHVYAEGRDCPVAILSQA
jgi:hypothetical protein